MIITDRNHGAIGTTTGKLMQPARRYWWEITGYDAEGTENSEEISNTEFEIEEDARAAYTEIKGRPGAVVMTENGRPDLEYVVVDGVEYVLTAHDEQTVTYED